MGPNFPRRRGWAGQLLWPIMVAEIALLGWMALIPANEGKATAPSDEWGSVRDGLRSKIVTERSSVGGNDPVSIHYSIQNVSEESRRVWHNGFWPSNRIDVFDPEGKPAALTRAGKVNREAFGGPVEKNYATTLSPRQIDEQFPVLNLRQYFVMNLPGKYSVQYTYQRDVGPVVSNRLQIIVQP